VSLNKPQINGINDTGEFYENTAKPFQFSISWTILIPTLREGMNILL
jgi:hypothetical protein